MKPVIRFSWKGALLAPVLVPVVYSAIFTCASPGRGPIFEFLFFFVMGAGFSYGTTVVLFLPCLYVVSRFARPTIWLTGLVGAVLAVVAYLPLAWFMYRTSGVDSGPPQGTFGGSLCRDLTDPAVWAFPVGGLITATVYWVFAYREARKQEAGPGAG